MNTEDKLRFARYRKGYIPPKDENEDINNTYNTKNKIGIVDKIDINTNILIKEIIVNNSNNRKLN